MSYEFKKLSEVQAMDEVPEGAKVLAEANGQIVRVPGSGLGGSSGIKTAIIKSSDYDRALQGTQLRKAPVEVTYSCINMAFAEAYEALTNGDPMNAHLMVDFEGATNLPGIVTFAGTMINNVPFIVIGEKFTSLTLYWTADGISTTLPGQA